MVLIVEPQKLRIILLPRNFFSNPKKSSPPRIFDLWPSPPRFPSPNLQGGGCQIKISDAYPVQDYGMQSMREYTQYARMCPTVTPKIYRNILSTRGLELAATTKTATTSRNCLQYAVAPKLWNIIPNEITSTSKLASLRPFFLFKNFSLNNNS